MSRRAIFLDRDGTLVHARHYPTRPDELLLFEGMADELVSLKGDGFALVMITNQSGIARGLFGVEALDRMHDHLQTHLTASGAALDRIYFCPHLPEGSVAEYAVDCACRKPRPGMLLQAARELDLELGRSWFVGDILDDVEAGNRAGCRTVLVDLDTESEPTSSIRTPSFVARSTVHALQIIRFVEDLGPDAELAYRPPGWGGPRKLTGNPGAADRNGLAAVGGGTGGHNAIQ